MPARNLTKVKKNQNKRRMTRYIDNSVRETKQKQKERRIDTTTHIMMAE
jgi:hypothetical protein